MRKRTLLLVGALTLCAEGTAHAARGVGAGLDETPTSYVVEGRVTSGGFRAARPGDRITIRVRDEATGRSQAITAIVSGAMNGPRLEPASGGTILFRAPGTAVEFLNLDPVTRNITVIGEAGQRQVFHVDESAYLRLAAVEPGEKVFLSYRFDAEGKAEALVRVAPREAQTRASRALGWTGEVVSMDVPSGRVTIRTGDGGTRTLVVHDAGLLESLEEGDRVVVGGDGVIEIRNR